MAAPGLVIPSAFTAKGDYIPQVNRMTNATDRMISSLQRLNKVGSGAGLSDVTKNVLSYAKSALLIGGAFSTARFSADAILDYETAIQSLQAVTGVGETQMVGFKKEIASLGATSKKSMTDVATSFEVVGSMMSQYLEDPKALRMITESGITLSKASRMQLEPALQSLTSVMNQFQIGAEGANKTVQALTAGEIVGSIRTSEASQYLQEFGAVAKNMNVNVSESVALVEALGIQMDKSKIGVGARNILTVIGAAGGLDKKARKDLRAAGVDMNFLMDKSHSLSSRLHELSKIAQDPVKMISVFGKENVTAASVIFNQLGTYDKFYNKILQTAEAENQAATNSKTLSVAIDEFKNKWANMLNSNDGVGSGLTKLREGLVFVTDNLETIISVTAKAALAFGIWKASIWAVQGALVTYRAISQAVFLVDMVKYISVTKGITTATAAYEVVMASLNGTMLMNPAFLLTAGLTALVGAVAWASYETSRLTAEFKKQIDLRLDQEEEKHTDAIKKKALAYYNLGQTIKQATENAIKFDLMDISKKRFKVESEIQTLKKNLESEKNSIYFADLFYVGGTPELGQREVLAKQLYEKQKEAANLAKDMQTSVGFAQQEQRAGVIGGISVSPYLQPFQSQNEKTGGAIPGYGKIGEMWSTSLQAMNARGVEKLPANQEDFDKKRLEIVIKNDGNSEVTAKSGNTRPRSVMPNNKSSFDY